MWKEAKMIKIGLIDETMARYYMWRIFAVQNKNNKNSCFRVRIMFCIVMVITILDHYCKFIFYVFMIIQTATTLTYF